MEPLVVGVLAFQGAFAKHITMMKALGVKAIEVRKPEELASCDALIIPGGESTTMMKHMHFIDFFNAFHQFAQQKPVFGTCAGLILIAQEIIGPHTTKPLQLLDVSVERNAFGRQAESFSSEIKMSLAGCKQQPFEAIFIRAPRIRRVGTDVKVLASYEDEPVLVQQGRHLGATFHPELTPNSAIHSYFLKLINSNP